MRNKTQTETALSRALLVDLQNRLPKMWSVEYVEPPVRLSGGARPDAVLSLRAPDRSRAVVLVEVTPRLEPRDVPDMASKLKRIREKAFPAAGALLAVAPYISERARDMLEAELIGYADSTGNLRLEVSRPSLFVRTSGADTNPLKVKRPLQSLRGRAAGRALRALVDFKPPYGVRQLADVSNTAAPTLSRVLDILTRDALVTRDGSRGQIVAVDWAGAIRRWSQDYAVTRSNRTEAFLDPRGLTSFLATLKRSSGQYAITGSVAANELNPVAEPRAATVYVEDITRTAEELGIRPAESGANVILAEPYDPVVFERARKRQGIIYACPSQVAVDGLTGPGRSPAEAEAVLSWMAKNEERWRVRLPKR